MKCTVIHIETILLYRRLQCALYNLWLTRYSLVRWRIWPQNGIKRHMAAGAWVHFTIIVRTELTVGALMGPMQTQTQTHEQTVQNVGVYIECMIYDWVEAYWNISNRNESSISIKVLAFDLWPVVAGSWLSHAPFRRQCDRLVLRNRGQRRVRHMLHRFLCAVFRATCSLCICIMLLNTWMQLLLSQRELH